MKKAVIKLKDGSYINCPADYLTIHGEHIIAYLGDTVAAIVLESEIVSAHISEKGASK